MMLGTKNAAPKENEVLAPSADITCSVIPPNHPGLGSGASARMILLNGLPVVCGGLSAHGKLCYRYNNATNAWDQNLPAFGFDLNLDYGGVIGLNDVEFLVTGNNQKQTDR